VNDVFFVAAGAGVADVDELPPSLACTSWLAPPGTGQNCSMESGALEPRELCYLLVYQTESTSANATQRE
jgi:hypothetical protein